ncbi:DUF2721 domain-containing protein [Haliovirga abyssi]|uniref:Membrane protein n=1 Tax=Haliovirga abyssi TaxID=2996794 RepID=A0AAU9DVP2_9FUSO|nr:DUF2721 domain-containing protein [Haliovirga abyssi]BDU51429.1 membrane protein [Haliovirga abyssi]
MTLTTPALLFPALSLLLLGYTNRFLTLAQLVRGLHDHPESCVNRIIVKQIENLRIRIRLIRDMQFLGVLSLFFCVLSMTFLFISQEFLGDVIFGISLLLMLGSLALSVKEIGISVDALTLEMSDCEIGNR